jgi:hemerythrin-like domain-containing protein
MSNLIEELKNEHKIILEILDQVKTLGISSASGQKKLLSAKDLLIAHMKKEDEQYYPALKSAAENNKDLMIMLDYFIKDMEDVSNKAMCLFDKYSQGGDEADFAGDITLLYMTLKDRIRTEEKTLFKKFSQLNK